LTNKQTIKIFIRYTYIIKDIEAIRDSKIVKLEDNVVENLLKLASEGNKYKRLVKDIDDDQKAQIDFRFL